MGKLYAVNFFSPGPRGEGEIYRKVRDYNTKTAYTRGKVDRVFEYEDRDITPLKEECPEIMGISRGAGLWLWKPYIIYDALTKIEEGDYLFYCDAGSIYWNDVHQLVQVMVRDNISIMPFELPLIARYWTKHETFVQMGCTDFDHNQCQATFLLMKNSSEARSFIKEWLEHSKDIKKLSGEHFFSEIQEFPEYISHREDQSILDILVRKHNLQTYREPSDHGYIKTWYKGYGNAFNLRKFKNSPYGIIVLNPKKSDPFLYERNTRRFLLKKKFGLESEFMIKIKGRFFALLNKRAVNK